MDYLRKVLRVICFYLVFDAQYALNEGTAIKGSAARKVTSNENALPLLVSISYNITLNCGREEENHICGGSLITVKHVLTAAYCLDGFPAYDDILVRIGSTDLREAKAHGVAWWQTYAQWPNAYPSENKPGLYMDIPVIKLRDVAGRLIPLPTISYEWKEQLYSTTVISAGCGAISATYENDYYDNDYSDIRPRNLRIAKFTVLRPEQCASFDEEMDYSNREIMRYLNLCTTAPRERLAKGDSGGLLLHNKTIVAVNSYVNCAYTVARVCDYQNLHVSLSVDPLFIPAMLNQ